MVFRSLKRLAAFRPIEKWPFETVCRFCATVWYLFLFYVSLGLPPIIIVGQMPDTTNHSYFRGPRPCFISWLMLIKVPLRPADGDVARAAGFRCQTRLRDLFLGADRAL